MINFLGKKKKKITGLCLGSGGVKGMAHLGALKVFEEENIEFDMVSGCSIGSIVGGLYAYGLSVSNIFELIKQFNPLDPQTLLYMKITGMDVTSLLRKMTGDFGFEDLKKPFTAVAVDLNAGKVVEMNEGSVALAMACSSAILPIFKPVEREGKLLIDGAYMNAVPADVLSAMGAEKIISINLSGSKSTNAHSKPTLDKMYPQNKVPLCNRLEGMHANSDLIITPELDEFSSSDLSKPDEIYYLGYEATRSSLPEIYRVLDKKS